MCVYEMAQIKLLKTVFFFSGSLDIFLNLLYEK